MTQMTHQLAISQPHAGLCTGLPCLDFLVSFREPRRYDADCALRDSGMGTHEGNTSHRKFAQGDSP